MPEQEQQTTPSKGSAKKIMSKRWNQGDKLNVFVQVSLQLNQDVDWSKIKAPEGHTIESCQRAFKFEQGRFNNEGEKSLTTPDCDDDDEKGVKPGTSSAKKDGLTDKKKGNAAGASDGEDAAEVGMLMINVGIKNNSVQGEGPTPGNTPGNAPKSVQPPKKPAGKRKSSIVAKDASSPLAGKGDSPYVESPSSTDSDFQDKPKPKPKRKRAKTSAGAKNNTADDQNDEKDNVPVNGTQNPNVVPVAVMQGMQTEVDGKTSNTEKAKTTSVKKTAENVKEMAKPVVSTDETEKVSLGVKGQNEVGDVGTLACQEGNKQAGTDVANAKEKAKEDITAEETMFHQAEDTGNIGNTAGPGAGNTVEVPAPGDEVLDFVPSVSNL